MRWTRLGLMTVGACLLVRIAVGQVSTPATVTFDVVSVRENRSGDSQLTHSVEGNRYRAINVPLAAIIGRAYRVRDVVDAPQWVTRDTFDVEAVSGRLVSDRELLFPMLQALLVERFKLVVRRESRETPGYALVRSIGPDWMGPGIERSSTSCQSPTRRAPEQLGAVPCRLSMTGISSITAVGVPISALLPVLSFELGARVIDRTDLTQEDLFDFTLRWSSVRASSTPDGVRTGDWPLITIALEDQLGLRLAQQAIPIDVVVVEHVERPSAN